MFAESRELVTPAAVSTTTDPPSVADQTAAAAVDAVRSDGGSSVSWTDIAQLVVAVASLGFVTLQLRHIRKVASDDFDQRRRQATFDYLVNTQQERSKRSSEVPPTTAANLKAFIEAALHEDAKERKAIVKYLNYYERLAAGVNNGVFEIEIVNVLWGSTIIEIADNYHDFITNFQSNKTNLWQELVKLSNDLKVLRSTQSK